AAGPTFASSSAARLSWWIRGYGIISAPTEWGGRRKMRCGSWSTCTRRPATAGSEQSEGGAGEQSAAGAGRGQRRGGGPAAGAAGHAHAGSEGAGLVASGLFRDAQPAGGGTTALAGPLRPRRRVRISPYR